MAIEDAGPQPERLAEAIVVQLATSNAAIPVEDITYALDISEIRYEKLQSFEGALLTTAERDIGSIIVNANASSQRRRFTLAHELGHFLNTWHTPSHASGFMCGKKDISLSSFIAKPGLTRHEVQELEANRFAIELLAPKGRIAALTHDDPSVDDVLQIAKLLELSKEAAARRYVDLHPGKLAVVFTQNNDFRYPIKSPTCPNFTLQKGSIFLTDSARPTGQISHTEIEINLPALNGQYRSLTTAAETYQQEGGHAFTLLNFEQESDDEDNDDGIEDTFERFSRF